MDGGTDGIRCGVLHNGAARRRLGFDAHGARTNPESLDDGRVARHDEIGGLDLGGVCVDPRMPAHMRL